MRRVAMILSMHVHAVKWRLRIGYFIHEQLIKRSDEEGRSMSNLAAHLIERALEGCGSVE